MCFSFFFRYFYLARDSSQYYVRVTNFSTGEFSFSCFLRSHAVCILCDAIRGVNVIFNARERKRVRNQIKLNRRTIRKVAKWFMHFTMHSASTVFFSLYRIQPMSPFQAKRLAQSLKMCCVAFGFVFVFHSSLSTKVFIFLLMLLF